MIEHLPQWYRTAFPYLDVASKLGLGTFIAWSILRPYKQREKQLEKQLMIPAAHSAMQNSLNKLAIKSLILKQVLPEAAALTVGVGAGDLLANIALEKYRERRARLASRKKIASSLANKALAKAARLLLF